MGERIYCVAAPFGTGGLVHCYLIDSPQRALIDTGTSAVPQETLLPALRAIGWDSSDLKFIINTHMHADHTGGIAEMKLESGGAPIHLHRADAHRVDPNVYLEEARADRALVSDSPAEPQAEVQLLQQLGKGWGVDRVLDDGDEINLGGDFRLRVIHTPGHTPGSASFYWEAEQTLFTGDAVSGRGSRPNGYPLYVSAADYRRSLLRLMDTPVQRLVQAHRYRWSDPVQEPCRIGPQVKQTLEESLGVWQAIDDAVRTCLARTPQSPFRQLFPEVLRLAGPALGNDPDVVGIPSGALPTVAAHWREQRGLPA